MTGRRPEPGAPVVRLGERLPSGVAHEGRLLMRCATSGVRLPAGAVLLAGSHELGPLPAGEHVTLRVLGTTTTRRERTDDRSRLSEAVEALRQPADRPGDVLVLQSESSVHAGQVVLRGDVPHDVVRAVEGEAHDLDAAGAQIRTLLVPKLAARRRAHRGADEWRTPLPPWGMRLARLVRDVRGALGTTAELDLRWADDGRVCRLVGAATRRDPWTTNR